MINKYDVLNSIYDKDTKIEISKIFDKVEFTQNTTLSSSTHFLTPNILSKALEIFSKSDLSIDIFGGYENAQRCILCFHEANTAITNADFNIDVLEITYNKKYSKELTHSDFLGSIMALSIKREFIGDIIVQDDVCYIFVCNTMSEYIINNLNKVGRTNVKIKKTDTNNEFFQKPPEQLKTSVTSTRIDCIISKIFNVSRSEVKDFINNGKVFVNWTEINDISKIIKNDDIVTLRGYGRIKFLQSVGTSKKGKIFIEYLKY